MIGRWLCAVVILLAGCGSDNRPQPVNVHITLEPVANSELWNVRYEVDEPIEGLAFIKQRNQFRSDTWVGADGAEVKLINGAEIIVGPRPTRVFDFRVSPYSGETQKDYEFFVRFTDGGTLVYTGHMSVYPILCGGNCSNRGIEGSKNAELTYIFRPRGGENVLVERTLSSQPVVWRESGPGRFVYFGKGTVKSHGDFDILGDSGTPKWIFKEVDSLLPKLLQFYSTKFNRPLSAKPLLFLSRDLAAEGGIRGGVLPNQIQVSVGGAAWRAQTEERRDSFDRLLAHEAAHLWNGDLFQNSGHPGEAWTHEGGAEALSLRALLDLGYIDSSRFNYLHASALEECALGLEGTSLAESESMRKFNNFYSCGLIIGLLTEKMTFQKTGGLFGFWRDLFSRVEQTHRYGAGEYLSLVREYSSPASYAQLVDFIYTKLEDPDCKLRHALVATGDFTIVNQRPLQCDSH